MNALQQPRLGMGWWLLLWPIGIAAAWRQRRGRWGRCCLGVTLTTAGMVLPLQTQLPWYSLLLWPGFCLSCGTVLAGLVRQRRARSWPTALWTGLGLALVAVALIALVAGLWLGLLLLMGSDHWLRELNESWSTPQAAATLRRHDQPRTVLLQQGERPSLNLYAGERIGSGTRQLRRALSRAPSVAVISAETPQLRGVRCRELERQGVLMLYQCLGSAGS